MCLQSHLYCRILYNPICIVVFAIQFFILLQYFVVYTIYEHSHRGFVRSVDRRILLKIVFWVRYVAPNSCEEPEKKWQTSIRLHPVQLLLPTVLTSAMVARMGAAAPVRSAAKQSSSEESQKKLSATPAEECCSSKQNTVNS